MLSLKDEEILGEEKDVNFLKKNLRPPIQSSALVLTDEIHHVVLFW